MRPGSRWPPDCCANYTDIGIIEPSDKHYYHPLWTLVGGGHAKASSTERPEASGDTEGRPGSTRQPALLTRPTTPLSAPTARCTAMTSWLSAQASTLTSTRPRGLVEGPREGGVSSNYRFDLAPKTWDMIRGMRSGTAVFTMPTGPVKCAGAGQKIAYLASDYWRKHLALEDIDVHLIVPGPRIFGIPAIADGLDKVIADYGIKAHRIGAHSSRRRRPQGFGVCRGPSGRISCCPTTCFTSCRGSLRRPGSNPARCRPATPAGVEVDKEHHAARALPERVQPRRRRLVTQRQDGCGGAQTGARGGGEHRRPPQGQATDGVVRRLLVMPDRHLVARHAAGRIRLRHETRRRSRCWIRPNRTGRTGI